MKLNQYSKEELREMNANGVIDICLCCGRYHENKHKPKWPMSNVSKCEECKSKENRNGKYNLK